MLFPVYWMLVTSLRPTRDTITYPPDLLPRNVRLAAYRELLQTVPIATWLGNTVVISTGVMLLCLALSILGAYALSHFRWRGRSAFGFLLLVTQMLPEALLVIPIFVIFRRAGLIDTQPGLILADAAFVVPVGVWILKSFMDTIPREVREAALIDGCGPMGSLWRITLPLSVPALITVSVIAFFDGWNEYLFASTFVTTSSSGRPAVGLASFIGELATPVELVFAAAALFTAPPIALLLPHAALLRQRPDQRRHQGLTPTKEEPDPMRITALETIQLAEFPNLCFVRLHTDAGLVGLGETFFGAHEVAAYLHETAAPRLLGKDPSAIDGLRVAVQQYVGTRSTGVESRGNSAVDIALWDLAGKATGRPVVQLLGGQTREAIRVYNTCAGYRYVRAAIGANIHNWGLPPSERREGPYEDLDAFLHGRAGELAQSLLAQGVTGMKMWPFDEYAFASGGLNITAAELDRGLDPFRQVRLAVGEQHGPDGRAARAVEPAHRPQDRPGVRDGGPHALLDRGPHPP